MVNNKRKVTLAILIAIISVCSIMMTACHSKGEPIELPSEDKIVKLQLHSLRFDEEKYKDRYKDKVKEMKEGVEQTEPISKREAEKHPMGKDTYSLGFFYKSGKREFFKFYKDGEEWFMKTKDGDVYANADFIAEYAEPEETEYVESDEEIANEPITFDFKISPELYKYGQKTGFDSRYLLANRMNKNQEEKTVDALNEEMEALRLQLFLYHYAMENGCKITEKELEKGYLVSSGLLNEEQTQEYEKQLTEALEEAGVSREIYNKGKKASEKLTFAVARLDEQKRQEFMNGTDRLKDVEYGTAGEYAMASRNRLLKEATETDKHKGLMDRVTKEVEDAKKDYMKYFGVGES